MHHEVHTGRLVCAQIVYPFLQDMPIKVKVEGHISNMGHLFTHTRDYKKHTYLAVPEVSVLTGEGIPVCARSEAMDHTNPVTDVTESVRAVASTVAKNIKSSTAAVLREESEAKKEEAAKKELADKFGVTLDAQREQYKTLERQQSLKDQKREQYPAQLAGSRVSEEEAMDHTNPPDVTESVLAVASTGSTTAAESQPQPTQPLPPHPVSHNLDVGSAVELVDPPGCGIIRWIGRFPDVNTDIAGIELVSCVFHCYSTSCLVLTLYCNAYVVSGVMNETVRSPHEKGGKGDNKEGACWCIFVMQQRGRDFPYLHAYIFIVLLGMVAQQGRALFHDNYTLQLIMAAHSTVLSQTKEAAPSWDTVMNVIKPC